MDLFGKALLAFYRGQSDAPIKILRNDGWEAEHSPGIYFAPDPSEVERPALALIDGPTLDVGCGAGRHLKWLGARGHKAYGLDLSDGAIEVCRAQGIDAVELFDVLSDGTPNAPFVAENISLFGNNMGIGGTFDGTVALLANLHRFCSQGGRLVLTGLDVRETDSAQHISYQEKNLAEGRRRGEIKIRMSYNGEIGPEFAWYHPEPDEVEELGTLTGWHIERLERCGTSFWSALRRS